MQAIQPVWPYNIVLGYPVFLIYHTLTVLSWLPDTICVPFAPTKQTLPNLREFTLCNSPTLQLSSAKHALYSQYFRIQPTTRPPHWTASYPTFITVQHSSVPLSYNPFPRTIYTNFSILEHVTQFAPLWLQTILWQKVYLVFLVTMFRHFPKFITFFQFSSSRTCERFARHVLL